MRGIEEIKIRSAYIRQRTPDVLAECYELQNHICDLCGYEIQCLGTEVSELDHSVSVYYFAACDLDLQEAEKQCNSRSNLRACHARCNSIKKTLPRDVWFAKGMDALVGPAKLLTEEEIQFLKTRASENSVKAGRITNSNPVNRNRLKRFATFETRSAGGKVGGRKNVETGQITELGRSQGQKNKESGRWDRIRHLGLSVAAEKNRILGIINAKNGCLKISGQGLKNAAKPGYMAAIGKIGGKKGGTAVNHKRWHLDRNIISAQCSLCMRNN